MLQKPFKLLAIASMALALAGCSTLGSWTGLSSEDSDLKQKESLYQTTQNNVALISLYRNSLQQKEDDEVRYKLSQSYYQSGDGESALLYLKPLLTKDSKMSEAAKILQIKSFILLENNGEAIKYATELLQANPKNGEAYNLRGIAYAQQGDLIKAREDIISARENFINDSVAINNLATLHLLSNEYAKVVELLMPQYLSDVKESKLVHNLVFALVKNNQIDEAKKIIEKENMHPNADQLIESLQKLKKSPNIK